MINILLTESPTDPFLYISNFYFLGPASGDLPASLSSTYLPPTPQFPPSIDDSQTARKNGLTIPSRSRSRWNLELPGHSLNTLNQINQIRLPIPI
ncbi:hypothetical protein PGTUg99_009472 [Puccinia graminis f. sp. tritici]|uniref:Uncharacterized protein n=1 Tax=Puccinia graminis f. sp. tritici TaxID=56615 RepID=A0A5B0RAT6_PUCGR|nr:hypothetical protein PGTUg99_009472 [Puccinia graminis f. sp. tritici]